MLSSNYRLQENINHKVISVGTLCRGQSIWGKPGNASLMTKECQEVIDLSRWDPSRSNIIILLVFNYLLLLSYTVTDNVLKG